jgi:hypothetical protein
VYLSNLQDEEPGFSISSGMVALPDDNRLVLEAGGHLGDQGVHLRGVPAKPHVIKYRSIRNGDKSLLTSQEKNLMY